MSNYKQWISTDTAAGVYVDEFRVTNADLGLTPEHAWSIRKWRLRGGLSDGVDVIEIDNGALSYAILPTRGMGIWRGEYRGVGLGWKSPARGPVHPAFVNQVDIGGIGWLAGFDEWIVRCGLNSNGAPGVDLIQDNNGNKREMTLPLHGRIANIPAHYVEVRVNLDPPHELEVIGHVDEAMLFGPQLRLSTNIRTTPGSASLTLSDSITNLKSVPEELQLLYHCNFGPPLLEQGARFMAPIKTVAPRDAVAQKGLDHFATYPPPTSGVIEEGFWFELHAERESGQTLAVLQNSAADKACALRFSKKQLPWFTLWKNSAAESDGYVTGLEPATNFPNLKTFERSQGRVVQVAPGGTYEAQVTFEVADTAAAVSRLADEVNRLQSQAAPFIHREPQRQFSPG